ncbi:MAG: hypothetical protein JWQ89_3803 [Devosia sp.]|uniref:hypothetical protein n=1 Tax=Devosia sp. TaxID=1871048 RepID=UPI00261A2037|nr:hypothetical protein [Devosia sp.]MDB5542076.1 hypothetical protein [Devosia sp.]
MLGLRALVVEGEYLVAAEIEQTLKEAGAGEITLSRSFAEASGLLSMSGFDLAIIEAGFGSPEAIGFSTSLQKAGVPVIVTSADRAVQSLFTGAIPLEKPFDSTSLLVACRIARPGGAASNPA